VTGGGTGIGRATALAMAKAGATVVIGNRDAAKGEEVEPYAEERATIACAIVAEVVALRRDQGYDPAVRLDADRRNRLVDLLIDALGGRSRGWAAGLANTPGG
jgi:NAD(P)-dependent dehydrogenase (short-subunit alcohol dehydrogenase family)